MNIKEIKRGAILSYLLIIVNTFYGLFFTPFLISSLGDGEYGVYKIIGSFIGSITVLDLGIGSTMLRYIAKFRAQKDEKNLSNFSAMGLIQAGLLSGIMVIVSTVMYFFIDNLYGESLNAAELSKAKELFVLFVVILVLNAFEKVLFGIISGCERYFFGNSMKLARILLKVLLAYLILSKVADSAYLLYIEIFLLVLIMVIQFVYIRKSIGIRIHYSFWDMKLFRSSFKYTVLMFLQSIAVQFNGNLDNIVIGSVINAVTVTIYSVGLQLYNMYEQFALAFSDLMLPTVSKQIEAGVDNRVLEDTVVKVGRLEFMALGGALCGFALIGREFISLWLGDSYMLAWWVGIILMVPTTVPLIQNICLSILRAKNKMEFRTIVVCAMAVFNLVITIIGVRLFGALAACIGTAIGLICANIIAMNIYYYKVLKLNVFRIFKGVLSKTWICCLVASAALLVSDRFIGGYWILWIVKVLIFLIVYILMLVIFGMNNGEKNLIFGRLSKCLRKKAKE